MTCLDCASLEPEPNSAVATPVAKPGDQDREPEAAALVQSIDVGVAGASARQEYERRKAKRETRVRNAHPHLGGLVLALTDDPQTTKAWATGARGEELLGNRFDRLTHHGVLVLHDRRIPGTRANIDHLAVGSSGVFVVDAKRYQGRPRLHVEGGLLRPRTEKLMVGSRDCTKLVAGIHKQVSLVASAVSGTGSNVPVNGFLCFVQADWPLFGGHFSIDGVDVLSPKKAAERIVRAGALDAPAVQVVHRRLAEAFPAST